MNDEYVKKADVLEIAKLIPVKAILKLIENLPPAEVVPLSVIEDIKAEIHETAEIHEDGNYYLRDEWIGEIIDKHISGKEK